MKILMVGASGKYAGYVLPALKQRGATVRALVTSAENVPRRLNLGPTKLSLET